jgi:hypothetical protein
MFKERRAVQENLENYFFLTGQFLLKGNHREGKIIVNLI